MLYTYSTGDETRSDTIQEMRLDQRGCGLFDDTSTQYEQQVTMGVINPARASAQRNLQTFKCHMQSNLNITRTIKLNEFSVFFHSYNANKIDAVACA